MQGDDTDPLTFTVETGPAHGTLSGTAPNLTYTPATDYTGGDQFTFRASDGTNSSNLATVTITVLPVGELINYALSINGGVPLASSTYINSGYSASGAIDGEHKGLNWGNGGGWNDGTRDLWPDSLEVTFNNGLPKTISEIRVYTLQNDFHNPVEPTASTMADFYGIEDFQVQTWDGSAWVTVSGGSVTGNDKAMRVLTLTTPVATTKVRVLVTAARSNWTRILEVEAFGAAGQ
jgi:hypothetical protein